MTTIHAVKHTVNTIEAFWEMTEIAKSNEKYKIDKNLQYLKLAPLSILRKIFVQYRLFTQYYITDLALLISKLPAGELKTILAGILFDELGNGSAQDAHPKLYDDFLMSIGIPAAAMRKADPFCLKNLQEVQNSLLSHHWAYGVGLRGMGGECLCHIYLNTMHEYFSQNQDIINMQAHITWKFWDIHIGEVDFHHQEIIRSAINELITLQPEVADDLIAGYQESKKSWDRYWDQIFTAARANERSAEVI
jgi:hypothetical protein